MQEFIHNKVKVLDELFTEFNQVQRLYAEKSFEFESRFTVFLNKLSDYFKTSGDQAKESEVLRVTNMLHTVKRGFNPTNQEKVNTGRRELLWGFAYNGIENLNSLMQEIYGKETSKLEEGEELLSNLILNLIQQGFLTDQKLMELDTIPKIEAYWNSLLTQNGSITVIHKKLLMKLISEDIYLLLEKIIAKIKSQ
ncbi:MAG TPA: hypothetical protein PKH68_06515 [Paludibacteraceae bacterium]|jgi:hypothetical protein|nr:hypothetical protein [Paludibacteraceae bacterium]